MRNGFCRGTCRTLRYSLYHIPPDESSLGFGSFADARLSLAKRVGSNIRFIFAASILTVHYEELRAQDGSFASKWRAASAQTSSGTGSGRSLRRVTASVRAWTIEQAKRTARDEGGARPGLPCGLAAWGTRWHPKHLKSAFGEPVKIVAACATAYLIGASGRSGCPSRKTLGVPSAPQQAGR